MSLAVQPMSWERTESGVPRMPLGDWITDGLNWLKSTFRSFFDGLSTALEDTTDALADLLNAPETLIMVVLLSLVAWLVKDWKLGLTSLAGLVFIVSVDQWNTSMETLALVLVATLVALLIGIPAGILAARSARASTVLRPVMDLMQTMPAFVWLVPVVSLFSIGVAGAVVATVIFALPPAVRLTELGIRQVDAEVVEAGHAFGATPREILRGIQFPLALPTIMAGINQVIMLALSMAVIAGLVGAGGLGNEVTSSIGRMDVGLGFEAGLSVVVLAIYLDRITATLGGADRRKGLLARVRGRRRASATDETSAQPEPAEPVSV